MLFDLFTFTLIVFVGTTAVIQVYTIISGSDERQVDLFARYGMRTAGMGYFGSVMLVAVVFILFRQTFLIGTLMLGISFLWMAAMQLSVKNYSAAFKINCFLLLIILMGYFKYTAWLPNICPDGCRTTHVRPKPVAVCGQSSGP